MNKEQPLLVYVVGYPGAGKTAFAKQIASQLGFELISADKLAFELFGLPLFTGTEAQTLYSHLDDQCVDRLWSKESIIVDALHNTKKQRNDRVQLAQQHSTLAVGVWIDTPKKLALARAQQLRTTSSGMHRRVISPVVFERYVQNFEAPTAEEIIIKVSGVLPFSKQLASFNKGLQTLPTHSLVS